MQCGVAYCAAVPWAMQVGLKRWHVVWGLSRSSVLAARPRVRAVQKTTITLPYDCLGQKAPGVLPRSLHPSSSRLRLYDGLPKRIGQVCRKPTRLPTDHGLFQTPSTFPIARQCPQDQTFLVLHARLNATPVSVQPYSHIQTEFDHRAYRAVG